MVTGRDLYQFAFARLGSPYMYGVNGLVITEALIQAKARQYPAQYSLNKIEYLRQKIGQKAYQCNSFTSILLNKERSANGWLSVAVDKGPITGIPALIGLTVHSDGHMGVYDGAGSVIEARGTYYGVVETRLQDRPWKTWAKMPGVSYGNEVDEMLKSGDKDLIKGGTMGTAVITWQKSLDLFGYIMKNDQGIVYPPDGSFGGATENATENFQRDHYLPVTGKVDLFSYSAMIDKLDKMAAGQKNKIAGAINLLEGIG